MLGHHELTSQTVIQNLPEADSILTNKLPQITFFE